MIRRLHCLASLWLCALALTAGCAKAPPPAAAPPLTIAAPPEAKVKAVMSLTVSADVNPDPSGRPSPVVVHVYQLRADAAFRGADFFALTDDEQKTLGETLLSHDEFLVRPSERRTVDVNVAADTSFVGVIAEFREFRSAQWRALVPAPREGFTVAVERARVVVSPAP